MSTSIWESDQKIGIELEFYSSINKSSGDSACNKIRQYLDDNGMGNDLDVCYDGSLNGSGVEVKFRGGIPLNKAMPVINNMRAIINDPKVNAEFKTVNNNIFLPDDKQYLVMPNSIAKSGTTGLHIHFDIGDRERNPLDLLRLVKTMSKNKTKINRLAWRESVGWASPASTHTSRIARSLRKALRNRHWFQLIDMNFDKYTGVNILNANSGYRTIEFRFADAVLMKDPVAFEKYLTYLKTTWDNSFTDEDVMQWNKTCFLRYTGEIYKHNLYELSYKVIDIHEWLPGNVMGRKLTQCYMGCY